jgi:two-component system chemotaxis sensor kinase CheA
MAIDISQFSEIFFDETEELLADLEKLLLTVNIDAPDPEDINAIFRIAHSIKGGAATFGFADLIDITHVLESMLDKIRHGQDQFTADHQEILLQSRDVLKMQLDGLRFNTPVDSEKAADIKMVLESMIDKQQLAPAPQVFDISGKSVEESAYLQCFHIELPEISEKDIEALAEELSLLGTLERIADPEHQYVVFELMSNEGEDEILALCSFILDPDDIKVSRCAGFAVNNDTGGGQADASAGISDDDELGYGFFLPPEDDEATKKVAEPIIQPVPVIAAVVPELKKPEVRAETPALPPVNTESSTIRVSVEKVDQLINLVGELVITHAMIAKRSEGMDMALHEKLLNGIAQLGQNSRDLQETAMSMRMMPIEVVFSRFPRMVRELSAKLGKQINLVVQGNSIELDKGLIEKIVDPLTHLVRNSIDHGIEKPDIRVQKAKLPAGRLGLSAMHRGGHVVIEISDDGAGLNRSKILDKARSEGKQISDNLSDDEVWQLIFAPGFSTAEVVTDLSGRGVGMDVVKRNIISLGGTVNIQSMEGAGTTITVSLPLTLAILDGMSIKVGDETYILPLSSVIESFQPLDANIKEISGQGAVIFVRGEYLPIVPLYEVFNIDARCREPVNGILVIITSDDRKAAILVDDLVGQQQIVVKNIESNYRKVPYISGATIMGDGSVSLIIDVSELLRRRYTRSSIDIGLRLS